MVFVNYNVGGYRKEVRELLRKRLSLRDKIRYHHHKISEIEKEKLSEVEKKLQMYLDRVE